ncbi:MAG: permease prefix domain 1-containing protein [Planctomycetes bacterium]|nr:permease prefix domain 1-containing protein [Planctomycetota bacterium]
MGGFFESLGLFWRAPDPRPKREIDGDIEEELAFHLAERERENRAAGMSAEEARADAERRFGDLEKIRGECRRVQMGERIVLQRLNFVLLLVLAGGVGFFAWNSYAAQRDSRYLIERMRAEVAQLNAALAERGAADEGTASTGLGSQVASIGPGRPSLASDASGLSMSDGMLVQKLGRVDSGARSAPPEEETADEMWNHRFNEHRDDWRHGLAVAQRLADECSCERAVEVLDVLYGTLSVPHKEQLFKPFVFHGGKPCALRVLHLGATDPEPSVRARAYSYLRDYAFRDFGEDYEGYLAWYRDWSPRGLQEVFYGNASAFLERVRAASGAELAQYVRQWRALDFRAAEAAGADLVQTFRLGGAVELAAGWIRSTDVETRLTGLEWLARLDPTEAELREHVLPIVRGGAEVPADVFASACGVFGSPERAWAVPELLAALEDSFELGIANQRVAGFTRALARARDPRATPVLVACIVADDTPLTIEGIGSNGLQELTGVAYDRAHDGAWWRAWWEKNSGNLPEPIRGTPLPVITLRK